LVPKNVLRHIHLGIRGKISEPPKKEKIPNYIISNNKKCLLAMKTRAEDLGISTKIVGCLSGDVKVIGTKLAKIFADYKVNCIIFGGEPTVAVKGKGKGGRNQELVLHTSVNLVKKNSKVIVISVGTDGIDGQTNSAGAIWEINSDMYKMESFLKNNDSHNFFKKYGGLIFTGPTGTNLMDIGLILRI
jgi:hydroxypyruvate reductase